jgi:hypothetical protein
MPPYRPAGKKAKETVFIRSQVAELYPALSARAARCFALGAQIESLYGLILTTMLDADAKPAAAMYRSLTSLNAQSAAVQAAAEAVLNDDELDVLAAISSLCNRAMKHRHRLAHWIWGSSFAYPEAIILIDPVVLLEFETGAVRFTSPHDGRGLLDPFPVSSCYVYDEDALEEAVRNLAEAERLLAEFRVSVIPGVRERGGVHAGFAPLKEHPAVKLELQVLAARRQNNQSKPTARPRKGRRHS